MIATVLAALVVAPAAGLLAIYGAEVLAGLARTREPAPPFAGGDPRTTVLIPAHNEAAGIARTLAALPTGGAGPVDVLVVADNCTDETARLAAAAGAGVIERHDPSRRGKGFALAFGRDALAASGSPPACVVVLDADCEMPGDGLLRLARACAALGRPVQSCNLLRGDLTAPVTEQVSTFAFLVKNLVRQRGMTRLGGVAALTGTGMALPWALFRDAPLASDDLVEDLALGIWLTRHGSPPAFLAGALTLSDPARGADLLVQRSRWEHGFVATARRRALPLVVAGARRRDRAVLWLGLHLLVPPLALLILAGTLALTIAAAAALLGGSVVPLVVGAGALAAGLAATALSWWREGRPIMSARALVQAPRYIASKLPVYRGLIGRRRAGWVRSRRADEVGR